MSLRPRPFEPLESRVHLSFSSHINFQPGGAAPASYLVDKGEAYGTRVGGYTYGWNIRNTANVFQRNSPASPDLRYDTVGLMQVAGVSNWQMIVPNGAYTVHIVSGDPNSTSGNVYKINAENVTVVSGTPTAAKPWVEGTATVTVADGRLTLSSPVGAIGNRIDFIDITDGGNPNPPPPPPPPPPVTGDNIDLEFNAAAGGVNGSGFAGALATSKGKGLISGNVSIGNGQLRLISTAGDATKNTQDDALNVSYNTGRDFVTTTRLTSFPFTKNWTSAGLFVGVNEDNYVKLIAGYSGGNSIQLGSELGGVFTSPSFANINPAGFASLDLRLRGRFSTKALRAEYRLNSNDDAKWVSLGTVVNASVFAASGKAGVLSTNFGSSTAVATSFNWFTINPDTNVTPPPPPPPPPPGGTPITIGTNLDGLAEYSPIAPFSDLATMFRPWGSVATPYTTDPSIPTNADNYPLADAGTITFANGYPDGDYQVWFQGQANLSFSGLNANFQITSSSGGLTTGILHLEPVTHPGTLALYATGVSAANPLHNLHIISPDANPAISDTFRPVFLQKLAPFNGYLRMMDWMQTYGSPVVNWSDRTLPTRFSYLAPGGVPYEVIAKLGNAAHKDPWICIPVKADDDYVHKIAQLFATNLDADRKVYVENSNELWAYWAQPDAMVGLAKSQADPAITKTDPWGQSAQEDGKRLVEISNIFKQEFGVTKWTGQVRPVLAGLVAGSSWGDIALQYINDHYGPVKNFISAYAIGDYVGVVNDFAPVDNDQTTLDTLFAWANHFVDTTLAGWIKDNKIVADKWNLPLYGYEGGQAFAAPNGVNEPLKRAAQDDPRMGDLYKHLIRSWTTLTDGGIFGNFSLANQYSQYGYWGVLQNIMQTTSVKYEAIKELVNETV